MRDNLFSTIYSDKLPDYMVFVGDIHGEFDIFKRQIKRLGIGKCCMISVGDFGVGFSRPQKEKAIFKNLNSFLSQRDIELFVIAGNHDAPEYFQGQINLSHFKLLPDYTSFKIGGSKVLFIGGAISIDRKHRKEGYSYWEDEAIKLPPYPITEKPDIIVAHDAPLWAGKDASSLYDEPGNPVKSDAIAGRKILGDLAFNLKPRLFVHGHYHFSYSFNYYGTTYRGLDINEFWSPTL